MVAGVERCHVAAVGAGDPVGAHGPQRVVALSVMNTVPPLFSVWSIPWSKNWPKKVNRELYGGESPVSVVTFGMKSVWCDGVQPSGTPSTGGTASGTGSVVHGTAVALPPVCVRCGCPAAATAAGLVLVWSSIRLLVTRTSESMTDPVLDLYDVGPGGPTGKLGAMGSASRKNGVVSRGKTWLAAPKKEGFGLPANGPVGCPGACTPVAALRLLQEPSTVRRPYDVITSGTWTRCPGCRHRAGRAWCHRGRRGQRRGMHLRDPDLLQDERQVTRRHHEAVADRCRGRGSLLDAAELEPEPQHDRQRASAANGRDLGTPSVPVPEPRDFLLIPWPTRRRVAAVMTHLLFPSGRQAYGRGGGLEIPWNWVWRCFDGDGGSSPSGRHSAGCVRP